MVTVNSTPKKDGFGMPGEFEPHKGCWMIWPERNDNWRNGAKPAQKAFAAVAIAIAGFEPVTMCVSKKQWHHARAMLPESIRVVEISNNDAWMRDVGPTFVTNDKGLVRGIDWDFNAWGGLKGGCYFPWDQDELIAQKVLELEQIDRYKCSLIMEGGSIHVDGEGTLITTEECLLNPNRNPQLTREQIEENLKEYLGVEKIIWLGEGIYMDNDTNGHVDNLCCFVKPGTVCLTWTEDKNDPQYEISMDAYKRLSSTTDALGRRLEIYKINQPAPLFITKEESEGVDSIKGAMPREQGSRLSASYINFYIANGGIMVPGFGDPNDSEARNILQSLFPDYKVVQIQTREILLGGGNIHCITQQQPLGKISK
ncbi:MAG: agmatine deiminase [Dehalococcoidales bacterium]|nr:agmatine deiminase [Dehalococcoidales bacterium]